MSVINGVGEYRGHNDRKIEVLYKKDGVYYGRFETSSVVISKWIPASWTADGKGTERWMPDVLGVREEPVTDLDPGEGYRLLKADEVVRLDDQFEYENHHFNTWPLVSNKCSFLAGHTVRHHQEGVHQGMIFRRKVEDPFPAGTKVRIKGAAYVDIFDGEYGVVAEERHLKHAEGWRQVCLEGRENPIGFKTDELEPDTRPELPEGYRYLAQQEVVQRGDEFLFCGGWSPAEETVGTAVKDALKQWSFKAYRRRTNQAPVTAPEPTPPAPPEGFQIMPSDYCIQPGDMVLGEHWKGEWAPAYLWNGSSRDSLNERFRSSGWTYWIASPIPKPFKISDHGPGVYRTREGGETAIKRHPIADHTFQGHPYPWLACEGQKHSGYTFTDEGLWVHGETCGSDLVEYLRPLPEPEWSATEDIRFEGQQRYVKGDAEEWRPTGVILTYEE